MSSIKEQVALAKRAIEAKWRVGEISWKLHAAQRLIDKGMAQAKGKLYVANCSRQLGKSYWGVVRSIELCLKKPKARVRYATAFLTDLEEFILPAFEKVMDDCPEDLKPVYLAQKNKFIFKNGSEIKLVGLDKKPNGLRGNTLDLIIFDECGFISKLKYLYNSVVLPATTHRPNAKIIFLSTPPDSPAHDFIEFCQLAEVAGCYSKFTIYDNPLLTKEQVEELAREVGGVDSDAFRREYLCEFIVNRERAVIPEWKNTFEGTPDATKGTYSLWHRYVSMDIGVRDLTVALFGHYDFSKATLYVEREWAINGASMTTQVIADAIRATEKSLGWVGQPYRRVADNNNLILIQDLSIMHDLSFVPTTKEALEAMVNQVRLWVHQGRVIVAPECKQLLGCLSSGIWDKRRKEFDRVAAYGHFDALAALVYLVRNIDTASNPIPISHGHKLDDLFLVAKDRLSDNALDLRDAFNVDSLLFRKR